MKTLYIHIGIRKTGTTALQDFFHLNREVLKKHGVSYPEMPFRDYRSSVLYEKEDGELAVKEVTAENPKRISMDKNGYFLHGWATPEHIPVNRVRLKKGLDIIADLFKQNDKVLLTDEYIYYCIKNWDFMEQIHAYAKAHDFQVKIIVFLRPQDDMLDSHFRQQVKSKALPADWDKMLTWYGLDGSFKIVTDYWDTLSYLGDIFGTEHIIVHAYEPKLWKKEGRSIFSILLSDLGCELTDEFQIPKPSNLSLSHNQAEIKRILNNHIDMSTIDGVKLNRFFLYTNLDCSEILPDKKPYRYFSTEEAAAFMERYEEDNRHIAEAFCRTDTLFHEPPKTNAVKWDPDPNEMQEDIILYFGAITKKLFLEVERLKRQNEKLKRFSVGFRLYRLYCRIFKRKKS